MSEKRVIQFQIVLVLFSVSFLSCKDGSLDFRSETRSVVSRSAPDSDGCKKASYRPKAEAEIAGLTPMELIDERVLSELYRDSFGSFVEWANYQQLIDTQIQKAGAKILPVISARISAYDPMRASDCDEARLLVASMAANDLDRFTLRVRGISEGRQVIDALGQAIDRMRKAGFDSREVNYENNRRFRIYAAYFKSLKDVNDVDNAIRETFRVKRKIKISDDELTKFSNFLVSRDPTYPTWTESELFMDYSQINEAGLPQQVYILKTPERFYLAYSEFMNLRKSN
jgi:hypothetical protein